MSGKVVTFGEIMLRLKSPAYERLMQSPVLEATFGGGEANVSVSLANYGMETAFVTVLPDNDIGKACMRELRGFGVDTTKIVFKPGRMGIYYLETGAVQRPSKVIYDRAGSAIAEAGIKDIDWDKAFEGATWFHITGITPAISQGAADLSLAAVKAAKAHGLYVSCDLNYRKNLWKDFQKALLLKAESAGSVEEGELNLENYKAIAKLAMDTFPNIQRVAITLRESKSANHNDWSACLFNGKDFFVSRKYKITDIVDRVGGGDSFGGGLIYGLNTYGNEKDALEFAVAASCLKHTIPGDYNRMSVAEVESLMKGSGSGRVQR